MGRNRIAQFLSVAFAALSFGAAIVSANGPEPAKPTDRTAANAVDDSAKHKSAPTDFEKDRQSLIDAENARDNADSLRAAYESMNQPRPGPQRIRRKIRARHRCLRRCD